MAKKTIRHPDFSTLVMVNREVVSLTKEAHEFTDEDKERLKSIVNEVKLRSSDEEFEEAVIQKASLLIYKIARGQNFHEGNKRTALVAGSAFLRMNGHSIDIKSVELVSVIDKVGVATASFNDVYEVVKKLIRDVGEGA